MQTEWLLIFHHGINLKKDERSKICDISYSKIAINLDIIQYIQMISRKVIIGSVCGFLELSFENNNVYYQIPSL